ncbi:MAG: hypothetical protein IPO02_07455 [Bacteroidetes bacterium]|nr:hypothetical protein [Bacteroidota bacterium]
MSSKGKIFGAGYELYIYAFFIGLYANKRKELSNETKSLGQPFAVLGKFRFKNSERHIQIERIYICRFDWHKTDELDLIAL